MPRRARRASPSIARNAATSRTRCNAPVLRLACRPFSDRSCDKLFSATCRGADLEGSCCRLACLLPNKGAGGAPAHVRASIWGGTDMQRRVFARLVTFAALAAAIFSIPQEASAQWKPTRAIRIVVPFGAGGTGDVIARTVASQMEKQTGWQFVVENK